MARTNTYRQVLVLTLSAAIICACLGSAGLAAWADNLPDSALARAASAGAHRLDDAMVALGANRLAAAIQARVRAVEHGGGQA